MKSLFSLSKKKKETNTKDQKHSNDKIIKNSKQKIKISKEKQKGQLKMVNKDFEDMQKNSSFHSLMMPKDRFPSFFDSLKESESTLVKKEKEKKLFEPVDKRTLDQNIEKMSKLMK